MKEMRTMRTNRFRLLTVLLAAVMLVALSLNAYAAQGNAVTQDGLTAQVFTDKDSYQTNESVNVTVRVDNHTGKDVFIRTEVEVPVGVTLAAESASYDAVLQDGQTWTTSGGVASAETAGSVPATGDNAHAGLWIILAVLAVAGIAVLFVYGKNKKTWLSMLLCLTMLSGLVTTALPVEAADIHGSMEVSCTIQVDGEDAEVTASITYVIYDEDDSEDEAGDVTESVESSESGSSSDATEPSEPSDSGETIETSEPSDEGGQSNEESSESTEESSESTEENSESTEESSESTEEGGESDEEGSESTEEGGGISGGDNDSSEDEGEVIFDLTFDDLTTFEESTDYVKGGGYKGAVTLSTEFDHTTGSGQSLKMAGRTVNYHRVKIFDALADAQLGETYLLSAWVYSESGAENVCIGAYSSTGTAYSTDAIVKSALCDVPAKTWTKIEVEYTHEEEIISQLGIYQHTTENVAETIYLDDVTITKLDVPKKEYTTLVPVTEREGKRPTPDVSYTGIGNTYNDLIFYDRVIAENELTSDQMFALLPSDPEVLANHEDMLNYVLKGPEYTDITVVPVDKEDGMPFETAIRATVKEETAHSYDTQLELASLDPSTFEDSDSMLIIFYMRTIDVDNEAATGEVQLIVEQEEAPNDKLLKESVTTLQGAGWKKVYLPFSARTDFTRLCIRLGFNIQTVEFGGYQILNYGKDVALEALPSDTVMDNSDKDELFTRDVDWRVDAWNRIEEIRKGDINVVVKDEAGNVIPDAEITIDMYDHEFKWGTAINNRITKTGEVYEKYREAVSTFFNTAVSENEHKMARYLRDTTGAARSEVDAAKDLGLKYYRGHTLIWDKPLSDTYDKETDQYISQNSITEELMRLELAGDEDAINNYIQNNVIAKIVGDFKGELCDWDVVNETLVNHQLVGTYGYSMMKKWFDWVKQYDPTAKRYINECRIVGVPANGTLDAFKDVLDEMIGAGVDFDGIGIQSHFSTFVSPKAFYDELVELAAYGKELKITEFDCALGMHVQDEEAEASFVRDIMILAYSMEQMDGFLMWGFTDASHWLSNAVLFDEDWNLKLSGEQYMDLVYNKWWTQEEGTTDADGTYNVSGYYGDYLITAEADGKTATIDVQCYKGNDNTFEIILKDSKDDVSSGDNSDVSSGDNSGSTDDDVSSGDNSGSSDDDVSSGDNTDTPSEDNAIFRQTFDDLDSIGEIVNTGGGYKISNVTLTTDLDHTTGGGQCLKLSKRTHNYDRIRILNALADAVIGETYNVSVWVYSETAVDNLYVNGYYSGYDKNATEANLFDIAANTWTKVEFEYTHTDESILHIGIEQNGAKKVTGTIYVDDVTVTEKE